MSEQNLSVRDLTPEEVSAGLREGRMLLVDVREPNETAVERFPMRWWCRYRTSTPAPFPIRKARKWYLLAAPDAVR